jgi:hypothetical protein
MMDDINIYNRFLSKKTFSISEPFGDHLPTTSAFVKMKILGSKNLISTGDRVEYLTYKIIIQPSGVVNRLFYYINHEKNNLELSTSSTNFYVLQIKCNEYLRRYLSSMGEDRPVTCVEIENIYEESINESLLKESKHDSLVSNITKDILEQLKLFNNSDLSEAQIDLPDEGDYYQTPIFHNEVHDFFIELYLFKTSDENYKIIGDAPGSIEDDYIRIGIYYNPEKLKSQIKEIRNNLIYTIRHEYEHLLQVLTDYDRVTYPKKHNYKGDSLTTLLKRKEIEPQVRGYYLQSKKESKPFDLVISDHLDKLEKNKQISFLSPKRKKIVIDILIDYAIKLGLPIKTSI